MCIHVRIFIFTYTCVVEFDIIIRGVVDADELPSRLNFNLIYMRHDWSIISLSCN